MKALRRLGCLAWFACGLGPGLSSPLASTDPGVEETAGPPRVRLIEIEGVINPLTARYLTRELARSPPEQFAAVVVRLDTPGGLESSMREMTQALLAAQVPVVVYVSPSGARAASAGMFITVAAHVAAMAPGTNIGAAHPVSVGQETDAESVQSTKAENDAAALARSLAQLRGRNAQWAESAVRESVALSAEDAVEAKVVDLVAQDLDQLLRQIDGRAVQTPRGEMVLRTAGAQVVAAPMTWAERLLHLITDPNVAYLLFTLGMLGIAAELYNPGLLFPGILGGLSLILAFVAFGSLPLNWAGLLLLLLGIALLVAEVFVQGFGVLGIAGMAAFLLGSLMLYDPGEGQSPGLPAMQLNPWILVAIVTLVAAFFFGVFRAVLRARRGAVTTGPQALVGRLGEAHSELAPAGTVTLDSEEWSARAVGGPIHRGETVRVVDVKGVTLTVERRKPHPEGGS